MLCRSGQVCRDTGLRRRGAQRARAHAIAGCRPTGQTTLGTQLQPEVFCAAFRDNYEIALRGDGSTSCVPISKAGCEPSSRTTSRSHPPDPAEKRIAEVAERLDETYSRGRATAMMMPSSTTGSTAPSSSSSSITPRGSRSTTPCRARNHMHTVVRTPNGNDYGKDLLRQHHERFTHSKPDLTH